MEGEGAFALTQASASVSRPSPETEVSNFVVSPGRESDALSPESTGGVVADGEGSVVPEVPVTHSLMSWSVLSSEDQ